MARTFSRNVLNNLELGVSTLGAKLHGKSTIFIAARVKFNSFGGSGTVDRVVNIPISGAGAGALSGIVLGTSSSRLRLGARSSSADSFQTITGTNVIPSGSWQLLGGLINFPTDYLRMYRNNSYAEGTVSFSQSSFQLGVTDLPDKIGGATDASNNVDGDIAEVAIWTTDIGPEGIEQLSDPINASPLLIHPQSLVFYMPLLGRHTPEIDFIGGLTGSIPSGGNVPKAPHPRVFLPAQLIPTGIKSEDISSLDGEATAGSTADATMTVSVPPTLGQAKIFSRAGLARAGYTRSGYYFQNVIILINGVDVTANLWRHSLRVEDIINEQADLANLRLFDVDVAHGQQIIISLGSASNRIFGGTIQRPKPVHVKQSGRKIVNVSAVDWTFLLNRKRVYRRYTALNAHQIFSDIINNFTDGFTTLNLKSPSPNVPEIEFSGEYVATALTRVAQMVGWDWYVDANRDVHLFDVETTVTPKALTPTNLDFWGLTFDVDWTQIRTRVYVQGGGSVTTADVPPGSSEIPVETSVWYDPDGGQVQFQGQIINYTGVTANSLTGIPATGFGAVTHLIPAGSNINIRVMAEDTDAQNAAAQAAGEGDGVHEYSLTDQRLSIDGALARAQAELAMFKDPIVIGSYQTFERNIRSGASLVVNLPNRLVGTYKITKVTSELLGPGRILRTVEFSSSLSRDFYALLRSATSEAAA